MDRDGGEPFREVFLLVSATNSNTVAAGEEDAVWPLCILRIA